jgi:hypothetical protein
MMPETQRRTLMCENSDECFLSKMTFGAETAPDP